MLSDKKLNPIVTELFTRGRKLNIFVVFITQSYFVFPKNIRLISSHFFVMKTPNKRRCCKLIAINLRKQQKLDVDAKAIQQINFTGNLDRVGSWTPFFTEETKKTILISSKRTPKVLWFYFIQYDTLNVKLSNSQLNKLKSAIKNGTNFSEVTLSIS